MIARALAAVLAAAVAVLGIHVVIAVAAVVTAGCACLLAVRCAQLHREGVLPWA
jgi:uncharacterized membrane protein